MLEPVLDSQFMSMQDSYSDTCAAAGNRMSISADANYKFLGQQAPKASNLA